LSLISQCHKTTILHISCLRNKKVNWPGIIHQPVNAASRRIDVKTAKPGVEYRPH